MKRITVILTFPYLVPAAIALCVEHLWAFATQRNAAKGTFFGGEVPSYYILLPLALVIQILAGIPGSLIIGKTSSRPIAVFTAILLPFLPFVLIITSSGSGATSLEALLPLLGIFGLFSIGSSVSLYYLHYRKIRIAEQAAP
jgi:hypothetical protein